MLGVTSHPHDLAHLRGLIANGPTRFHLFADWILSRKIFLREPLINNNDRLRFEPIGICEKPATNQWDAHGLEIIRANEPRELNWLLILGQRMFCEIERGRGQRATHRQWKR